MQKNVYILIILIFLMFPLCGETLYIAVSGEKTLTEMDQTSRVNLTGLENGLMDFLFDSGHIFFNNYTPGNPDLLEDLIDDAMLFAAAKGAPYMLFVRLQTADETVNFNLYDIREMESMGGGSFQVDNSAGLSYYKLGQRVGREVFKL